MSSVVCDEGIVLRVAPQTNTSLQTLWLMREHGCVSLLFKGAQRPKSYLLGQLDLFYTCEVVFYHRPGRAVQWARECYPNQPRTAFRSDWAACATASWLAGLVALTLLPGGKPRHAYARLASALDALAANADPRSVQHWFELHWLDVLGLTPQLHRCAACGGPPQAENSGGIAFSAVRGGVLCRACRRSGAEGGPVFVLTPETQARLRAWQRTSAPKPGSFSAQPARQAAEAEGLLGAFLQHHMEIDLAGRDALRAWRAFA